MLRSATNLTAALALLVSTASLAAAADAEAYRTVRMSDPGWTDITSTNAILGNLLEPLGYQQDVDNLGVPITFEALKNGAVVYLDPEKGEPVERAISLSGSLYVINQALYFCAPKAPDPAAPTP